MSDYEKPSQGNDCSEHHMNYLEKAAEACAAGDMVLGMHLYLAAYEETVSDPSVPDGMALTGLREAWHLACDLKERSMAEYVFEKLEPYLMPDEIAECANQLQELALDRLEQIGFSRDELQDMAQMIAQDLTGDANASVVKVESVSIPHAEMFGVPSIKVEAVSDEASADEGVDDDAVQDEAPAMPDSSSGEEEEKPAIHVVDPDDFNPYDYYRDYSIGKSWHSATNEGSGAEVFTRDEERAEAHEKFVADGGAEKLAEANRKLREENAAKEADEPDSRDAAEKATPIEPAAPTDEKPGALLKPQAGVSLAKPAEAPSTMPSMPNVPDVVKPASGYRGLAGYDEAVRIMRDLGVGMQDNREYLDFVAMLNARHGLDRKPSLDSILFRASAIEDAARFADATIEELGLPPLRMAIEENVMGVPVLCITADGNNRPRMNHAHNRFEAPAILVVQDLDLWTTPEVPEGVEGGMNAVLMANLSRGAREALSLIRASVEDPDVIVLATATTLGEVDPFYYEMLEPMTVIDIGLPTDEDRAAIWAEIARDHASMRDIDRDALVRYSDGLARCDIYLSVREALEEAYKIGLMQREYVPVTPQNIFEKLAACQPLESEVYSTIEDEVVRSFKADLEHLEDLIEGLQE